MIYFPQVFDIKLAYWLVCCKLMCLQKKNSLPKETNLKTDRFKFK